MNYLSLHGNKLSGPIPSELGNLSNLRNLHLQLNKLNGPIPPELGNLNNLDRLYLSENLLSGAIPASLSKLNLIHLDLTNNPDLKCWETEEALKWALSIEFCDCSKGGCICNPGYFGPKEVCQP